MADSELVLVEPTIRGVAYPEELIDVTKAYLLEARAKSTREAYARQWASFTAWCDAQGRSALPASPETIVAWLAAMASGIGFRKPRARATINQALSAVLQEHRRAQLPLDRKHPYISEAWRGISRVKAKTDSVRKAKPVLGADLAAMLDGMGNRPIDLRDKALLAVGWAAALRRSELVGLDWMVKGDGQGHVVIDAAAVTITLATSKASQDEAETIVIPVASMKSASDALLGWISLAGIKPGEPIFRAVDQHQHIGETRLTDRSVSNIIKVRVLRYARKNGNTKAAAKAMAAGFSGHSLRAGFVTTAARSKVPGYHIRQHSRHKSVQTVEGYIREADKLTDSVLKTIGF